MHLNRHCIALHCIEWRRAFVFGGASDVNLLTIMTIIHLLKHGMAVRLSSDEVALIPEEERRPWHRKDTLVAEKVEL